MRKCLGCGIVLQNQDPHALGYTPKADSLYCKRCFRLRHYDDLEISMRQGIDAKKVLTQIEKTEALLVWVVDLFDFEAGMLADIQPYLQGRKVVLACTKRDLFPADVKDGKLYLFVRERLRESGITAAEIFFLSIKEENGVRALKAYCLAHAVNRSILFFGRANSGKSTLINRLIGEDTLTCSRYPGTTLQQNRMQKDGVTYIDTPGIEIEASMVMAVREADLKQIIPAATIKPAVYPLYEAQSFALGGLARLDLAEVTKASAVFYCSSRLPIHRGALVGADALWEKHYGALLRPIPLSKPDHRVMMNKPEGKVDVVIDGLGWVCVSGAPAAIVVHVPEAVRVTFRKAMIG